MSYLQSAQQFEKPGAALVLKGESDLACGVIRVLQLDHGVHERATSKPVVGKASLELIEALQYLLCRWPLGDGNGYETTREIGGDEVVLRRKIVIQGSLADPDFRRDLVHTDRSDAVAIEQAVDRFEDPLLHS